MQAPIVSIRGEKIYRAAACGDKLLQFLCCCLLPVARGNILHPVCQLIYCFPYYGWYVFCNKVAMPEGPSIVILKESIAGFNRKKILKASGNAAINLKRLENNTIRSIKTWGKHLLICFDGFFIRIHLLMFGTYLIDDKKSTPLKLGLQFKNSQLNFYTCAVKLIEGKPDEIYDWTADVMNAKWDGKKAMGKLKKLPGAIICDVLLDQEIFSGVGNIIKNEILFNCRIHPQSLVGKIPPAKKRALVNEAASYSFDFLKWKKADSLKKHWQAYSKKKCLRCNIALKKAYPGKTKRRSFFCDNCQVQYG